MKRRLIWVLAASMILVNVMSYGGAGVSHAAQPAGFAAENGTDPAEEEEFDEVSETDMRETQPETEAEAGSETKETETQAETNTETEVQPETGTVQETASETETVTETEDGDETETETETETVTEPETETESETETETELKLKLPKFHVLSGDFRKIALPKSVKGEVEILLGNALPAGKETLNVRLFLYRQGSVDLAPAEQQVQLAPGWEQEKVVFSGLETGDYRLEIDAPGFGRYVQDIGVDGEIKTLEIYTGFLALDEKQGFGYGEGQVHPGTMLLGDANRDGALDDEDKNAIIDAIEGKGDGRYQTDLDGDGKTTLTDLQYFADSLARSQDGMDLTATVSSRVAPSAVGLLEGETTTVSGNLEEGLALRTAGEEAISEQNPVEIGFSLEREDSAAENGVQMEKISIEMGENAISEGTVLVETENGETKEYTIRNGAVQSGGEARADSAVSPGYRMMNSGDAFPGGVFLFTADSTEYTGTKEGNALEIDLGGQIAVKKVTLRITGTSNGTNLAEISRVEFLNDMENRIPEIAPQYPQDLRGEPMDKAFTLSWTPAVNVTGYEVKITSRDGRSETFRAAAVSGTEANLNRVSLEVKSTSLTGDGKLVNGDAYEVCVQSVNGAWTSGYSPAISVIPQVSKIPDPPDNLKAEGGLKCVRLQWKDMKDTDSYSVYYKEKGAAGFTKVQENLTHNSYEITGLKDQASYEVYVTGTNSLGESAPSIHSAADTVSVLPALMPKYRLINASVGVGSLSAHIVSVTHGQGAMVNSQLDKGDAKTALGAADKDFGSYYQMKDWDDGAHYESENKGLIFTFDQPYKMNYITFAESENLGTYTNVSVFWYDRESAGWKRVEHLRLLEKRDANNTRYYAIKLNQAVTTDQLRLGFTRGNGYNNVVIAEVNFYDYDPLEDDILALYADDLHSTLRPEVGQADIEALQKRLDTRDEKSGEYHPERAALQKELDTAKAILDMTDLNDVVQIYPSVTAAKDGHLGFGGLNGWQPLGVSAAAGEQIVIYVGHNVQRTGDVSRLKLIATQHHAEASAFAKEVATLRVGRNEITLPSIQSLAVEGGGSLYVEYTGNDENDRYAVRVSGGTKIPMLNLYRVTDEGERSARILSYVKELEEQAKNLERLHRELHEGGTLKSVDYGFEKENCILDATDIMLDQMMYSVSGKMLLDGLGKGTLQEKADRLDQSLQAMEQMMTLFYHHKGLTDDPSAPATDRLPVQHLNIRYMRMFAGAFMYASGNHIGIEYGSVPGLSGGVPVSADAEGRYLSGNWFGWGISHEIGHDINQSAYAIAEVTNNYFALLSSAKDTNASIRFEYPKVYEKVTSNTVGRSSNVFTQLALYWQLHLAYDRGYNYKIYDTYTEQKENLFFARVDSYARNTSLAPEGLVLGDSVDQNFMRLSCAAAQKDLTDFFIRWGMVPDTGTYAYARQFEKEERALYYLTDDARAYEIEHGTGATIREKDVISVSSTVKVTENVPNEVTVSIVSSADPDVLLGYEIVRYQYEDGRPVGQVVGFTTEDRFVDHVSTVNNRVMDYEVTAVDKFGYRSAAKKVGTVRIAHEGQYDKSAWTFDRIALESELDELPGADETDPCEPEKESALRMILDNDYSRTYTGTTKAEDAVILISFHQVLAVSGLKYTVRGGTPIADYEVAVSQNGTDWTTVKTGTFAGGEESQTVYFENEKKDPWVCTYDAAYLRLRAIGQKTVSITELDVLGPSGDSVSFGVGESGTNAAVGILQNEYVYDEKGSRIPQGSLIFTGNYKGNPAYNVVVLYDGEGNILGGTAADGSLAAQQIILAKTPEHGELGEVSSGIWIYWIEPDADGSLPEIRGTVRAQLYRVDNALNNQGQRLVSDTMPLTVPEQLPQITLQK